jgi:hypothetical protein
LTDTSLTTASEMLEPMVAVATGSSASSSITVSWDEDRRRDSLGHLICRQLRSWLSSLLRRQKWAQDDAYATLNQLADHGDFLNTAERAGRTEIPQSAQVSRNEIRLECPA